MNIYIPVLIAIVANTFYHICAKSTPEGMNTFASLSVTYAVAAVCSLLLFAVTGRGTALLAEYQKATWSSFILGLAVVGLEVGFILMYKVGWTVSTAQLTQCAGLAVVLLFVGYFIYGEPLTLRKAAGVLVCLAGLYLLNK